MHDTATLVAATTRSRSRSADLVAGAKAMTPWLIGVVPFGLVTRRRSSAGDSPAPAA